MHIKHIIVALFLATSVAGVALADSKQDNLPTIEKNGVKYYQYTMKENESLYGIAKQMDWNYELLDASNPDAADKMGKGYVLLYPAEVSSSESGLPIVSIKGSKMTYEVTDVTNPTELAKLLNVTTDEFYQQNPEARWGLKKGDLLTIDYGMRAPRGTIVRLEGDQVGELDSSFTVTPVASTNSDAYSGVSTRNPLIDLDKNMLMEYTIQPGDNAGIIASNFNTTVRDIFYLNKGVSEAWFPQGLTINILPGSKDKDHHMANVDVRVRLGEKSYKIKAEDTLESIASAHNVTVEELLAANSGDIEMKKGNKIDIPVFSTFNEMRDVVFTDPREATSEGREEIYTDIWGFDKTKGEKENPFRIVILTSTNATDVKRDGEFLRGFILGANEINTGGKNIDVQVLDITQDKANGAYFDKLKSLKPTLIVASFDKDFPADLVEFAQKNNSKLINVFDAKSEAYKNNTELFQVLLPSAMMNQNIANYLYDNFGDKKIIFVEDNPKETDGFASLLQGMLKNQGISFENVATLQNLKSNKFVSGKSYVIISGANTQTAVSNTLKTVSELKAANSGANIALVGRPTWIVYANKLMQSLRECDTYIPSRFFYNSSDKSFVNFNEKFSKNFQSAPVESYPPYAAMGYDVARYFITSMLNNEGDFNRSIDVPKGIEVSFDFKRVGANSGLVNKSLYFIHYDNKGVSDIIF